MTFTATAEVPADRPRVFAALVDPDVLRQCIPGCEELVALGDDTYQATLKIGVAGLKGSYGGRAEVRDQHPPDTFTIRFEGKGGPGFVKGTAAMRLTGDAGVTHVSATADVQVGGLIAAVGSRLIEATAKKLAADFFRQLADVVAARS